MKEKKKLSLPIKIFIGMALGIIAGLIFAFAHLGEFTKEWIKPIGTIYVMSNEQFPILHTGEKAASRYVRRRKKAH